MIRLGLSCVALLAALPAAAAAAAPESAPAPTKIVEVRKGIIGEDGKVDGLALARVQVAECDGNKFAFQAGEAGKGRVTRITLCGKKGASPEEVVAMLDKAAATILANDRLPDDRKTVIVAQIRAKQLELQAPR